MNKSIPVVANRQINLTYIIAGCLSHAFDDMQDYLKRSASDLNQENKICIIEMIKLCKRFMYYYERLRKSSVTTLTEEHMYYHNDAIDKYYSLLMTLITRIGSDDDSDLRGYALLLELTKFPQRIKFPREDFINRIAWQGNINHIDENNISPEDLYKLLTSVEDEVGQK